MTVTDDNEMVFLVLRDIVVLTDLREAFCAAGLDVREFRSHDSALDALRSGPSPRAAVFDTPLGDAATALEREIKARGIPFTRLAAVVETGEEFEHDDVVEMPFRTSQVLDVLRRRLP